MTQDDVEHEPLAQTQQRIEAAAARAARKRLMRYLVLGTSIIGGGLTASQTGALDTFFSRAVAAKDAPVITQALAARVGEVETSQTMMGKRVVNIDRKLNWLVRQEVRRQERECRRADCRTTEPPEDIE